MRKIIVDNSGNPETLSNYQVFLNVTYDSDMQADFDDLRFTWYDETLGEDVAIDYWLDKYVGSEYALVWVEVPEIRGAGEEVLYMYYGDPDAVSESNGEATFVFFDDFSTDTTPNYEILQYSDTKGTAEIGWNPNGWLLLNATYGGNQRVRPKSASLIDATEEKYWFETRAKGFGPGENDHFGLRQIYKYDLDLEWYYSLHCLIGARTHIESIWGCVNCWEFFKGGTFLPDNGKNVWYRFGVGTSSNGTVYGKFLYDDYNELETIIEHTIHQDNEWWVILAGGRVSVYFDYVRVRKFTDPEPTYIMLLPATVDVDPDTLNLKSNGQWITAYIELPEEYSPTEIDVSSILLNGSISVDLEAPTEIGDHDMDGIPDLMVKFERAAVIALLGTHDYGEDTGKSVDVALVITGDAAGTSFEGVDTIRVLLKG